jgi:hypothetical protein
VFVRFVLGAFVCGRILTHVVYNASSTQPTLLHAHIHTHTHVHTHTHTHTHTRTCTPHTHIHIHMYTHKHTRTCTHTHTHTHTHLEAVLELAFECFNGLGHAGTCGCCVTHCDVGFFVDVGMQLHVTVFEIMHVDLCVRERERDCMAMCSHTYTPIHNTTHNTRIYIYIHPYTHIQHNAWLNVTHIDVYTHSHTHTTHD